MGHPTWSLPGPSHIPRTISRSCSFPVQSGPGFDARDYRTLIRKTFYGTGFVDFKVLVAESEKVDDVTGYDDKGKAVNFTPEEKGKKKKDEAEKKKEKDKKEKEKKDKDDDKGVYMTKVVIGRDGDMGMPVDVVLTFKNGRTWRTTWDGRAKWIRYSTQYASKLAKVEIDPDQKILLDGDPFNNARHLKAWKGASASKKVTAYALHMAQIVLSSLWPLGI